MANPWEEFSSNPAQSSASPAAAAQPAPAHGPWEDFAPVSTGAQTSGDPSYSDLVHKPTGVADALGQVGDVGRKAAGELATGAGNFVGGIPDMVKSHLKGMMPTVNVPSMGGQMVEDTANQLLKAKDLASKGKFSDAAKQIPVLGGMYDYATTHPIMDTAGYLGAGALLGKAIEGGVGKFAKIPEAPASVMGESPAVKSMLEVFKPSNAQHAMKDYPIAVGRLLREHPELASGKATLPQIEEALQETMTENRHYAQAFTGPAKAAGMPVNLTPIADAIESSITPLMRKNAAGHVASLEKIADKYRGVGSINDVESMLQETNAKVADMRKLNPGDWAQATNASDTKGMLDATNKAFRETYYKALDLFGGSEGARQLNREYGTQMGLRQDLQDMIQQELVRNTPQSGGLSGKLAEAGSALRHPVRAMAGKVLESLAPPTDNISKLAKALKDFKGPPALDYPAPPQARLSAPPDTSGSLPAGRVPRGFNQKQITGRGPATPMPGETYGPDGMGPVVSSEKITASPQIHDTSNMVPVREPNGQRVFITREQAKDLTFTPASKIPTQARGMIKVTNEKGGTEFYSADQLRALKGR